jgi:biotin carboxyl carrier protein
MGASTYIIDGRETTGKGIATLEWQDDNYFTIHFMGKTFMGEIVDAALEDRKLTVKVNHRTFEITKKHPLDDLIKELGLDKQKVRKLNQLVSPMPGRVINFTVNVGDIVTVDTPLLTLEAMKMENVIKSEGEGIVKALTANPEDVVEKGQVLIDFE